MSEKITFFKLNLNKRETQSEDLFQMLTLSSQKKFQLLEKKTLAFYLKKRINLGISFLVKTIATKVLI